MSAFGYAFIKKNMALFSPSPRRPALLKPTLRVERTAEYIAIPAKLAPEDDEPLTHILFALKHEGTDLAILLESLAKIPGEALVAELKKSPAGIYIKKACYLWEAANHTDLQGAPPVGGNYVDLFDPEQYVTMRGPKSTRWRVNFNGLGSLKWCASVERTATIVAAMDSQLLKRVRDYAEGLGGLVRDRALAWAYLDETKSSFAIEREVPSEQKKNAFVALLHSAHKTRQLDEDYLVDLQKTVLTNPYDYAESFRTKQNYLGNEDVGAVGVTYVPPPPELVEELMVELMAFSNAAPKAVDPVIAGAVASFGFVFIHPFIDGNGRLSRFLMHYELCQSGELADGLILPVSISMKRHEMDYLTALKAYSAPMRELWDVTWLGDENYTFDYHGSPGYESYRYWDATEATEFCYAMAEQALTVGLRESTIYLLRYDRLLREIDQAVDINGPTLRTLVQAALGNEGVMSKKRRDKFATLVPAASFDLIETIAKRVIQELPMEGEEPELNGALEPPRP